MSKEQIKFAGTSRLNGELKFRTATSAGRVAQLERTDTEVSMLEIQPVDTKPQAARALLALGHMSGNAEITAVYVAKARDENPFAKPKARKNTVVVRVPTRFAQEVQGATVEVTEKLTPKQAARIRAEFNAKVKAAYEAN
jgi:DNA-binding transcriptional regulator YdaS (Cro superfamily)